MASEIKMCLSIAVIVVTFEVFFFKCYSRYWFWWRIPSKESVNSALFFKESATLPSWNVKSGALKIAVPARFRIVLSLPLGNHPPLMWISKPDDDDSFECARHDWAGFPFCEGCFSILKFQLPVPSSNRWTSNWHPCPPPTLWHLAVFVDTREPSQQLRAISASDSELWRPQNCAFGLPTIFFAPC